MTVGLLLESVQAQQKMVESQLDRLHAHTQGLDGIVRDEIRRTLVDELKTVSRETTGAVEALQRLKRAANWRAALFGIGMTAASVALSSAIVWWALPSQRRSKPCAPSALC